MPIDQQDYFSVDQAITGDAISDNVIDLGANTTRHGVGTRPMWIVVHATTAFTDAGNNTTFEVRYSTSPYVGINSSITNTTLGTIGTNQAVGVVFFAALPPIPGDNQYAALNYVTTGGNASTGKITAYVTSDPNMWSAKPKNWTGPSTS